MKISLNWVKRFVDIPDSYSGEELGRLLTLKTAEVEEVADQGESLDKVVVGEIKKIEKHPDADMTDFLLFEIQKEPPSLAEL